MSTKSESVVRQDISYGYRRTLELPFAEAVGRTQEALRGEGFGVLCQIDLQEKLREKLGVSFGSYIILGACNPPIAYEALQKEMALGLLLPCNVAIYEESGRTVVAAIDAARMMSVVGNPQLEAVAMQVNEKLQRAIDSL